jgi:hypothetical protein
MDRHGYLMSIREKVERGEYRVDPAVVAAAILERIAVHPAQPCVDLERVLPAVDGPSGPSQLRA